MDKKLSKSCEFIDEYWNKKNRDSGLFTIFSDNLLYRTLVGRRCGRGSYKSHSIDWDHTFPDYQMKLDSADVIGNTVVAIFDSRGTYTHPFTDHVENVIDSTDFSALLDKFQPVGAIIHNKVEWTFIFQGDKIVKLFCHSNEKELYQQLGLQDYLATCLQDRKTLFEKLKILSAPAFTSREVECIALVLTGLSAKSIAMVLKISYRTVETYLQMAYKKLKCTGRQQCVEIMYENQSLFLWQEFSRFLL